MNQRYPTRRPMRLRDYDYRRSGVYFVTICTYQHVSLFGNIFDGDLVLNELGEIVNSEWLHVAQARTNVLLDNYVIMPNHLHGIVIIDNENDRVDCTRDLAANGKRASTLQPGSLGAIVGHFKAAVSRRAKPMGLDGGRKIWQRNYYEHIIRNEKSLKEIRKYILENPARWSEDDLYDG
ncbi:MAG: transposase [Chloroflexi bacterium]|nr:transposase [Chloroflexota bacterium]